MSVLYDDESLRRGMAAAARARVQRDYSKGSYVKSLLHVYKLLASVTLDRQNVA
jgi:glycosyltransferase involved in cell wall biosynthesis